MLDELIPCLERYAEATGLIVDPALRKRSPSKQGTRAIRWAGAA
jgi:hypothetical protein